MARSLTVQHEEDVSTSPLLWGFLALAALWLVAATFVAASTPADAATPDADVLSGE